MVQAVPDDVDRDRLKRPFPEKCRGLEESELKETTGIETLRFCHLSVFLCATDTLQDAIKVAEQVMESVYSFLRAMIHYLNLAP